MHGRGGAFRVPTDKCGGSTVVGKSFCNQHSKDWFVLESSMDDKLLWGEEG